LTLSLAPATGDVRLVPAQRSYQFIVHGIVQPEQVTLTVNSQPVTTDARVYDPVTECLTVTAAGLQPADTLRLTASTRTPALLSKRDRRAETIQEMLRAFRLDTRVKAEVWRDLPALLGGKRTLECYALSDAQAQALAHVLGRHRP
jgi:hypothetical protein